VVLRLASAQAAESGCGSVSRRERVSSFGSRCRGKEWGAGPAGWSTGTNGRAQAAPKLRAVGVAKMFVDRSTFIDGTRRGRDREAGGGVWREHQTMAGWGAPQAMLLGGAKQIGEPVGGPPGGIDTWGGGERAGQGKRRLMGCESAWGWGLAGHSPGEITTGGGAGDGSFLGKRTWATLGVGPLARVGGGSGEWMGCILWVGCVGVGQVRVSYFVQGQA
jgi:hypothetical protein